MLAHIPFVISGLVALSCAACAPRAALSVFVPVVTFSLDVAQTADDGVASGRRRTRLAGLLLLSFQPRALRASLPSTFDIAPQLAALPCEEDDTTCFAEAGALNEDMQRLLGELP